MEQGKVDFLINELFEITINFIYAEYYPHTNCMMWKIDNQFTKYAQEKIVLCFVSDGIEKALTMAIEIIKKRKHSYFNDIR